MSPPCIQYVWSKVDSCFCERLYLYDISRVSYIYSVKSVFLPILLSLPFCPLILFCLFYQEYYVHFASSTYRGESEFATTVAFFEKISYNKNSTRIAKIDVLYWR